VTVTNFPAVPPPVQLLPRVTELPQVQLGGEPVGQQHRLAFEVVPLDIVRPPAIDTEGPLFTATVVFAAVPPLLLETIVAILLASSEAKAVPVYGSVFAVTLAAFTKA
jgi:hypothetical protein